MVTNLMNNLPQKQEVSYSFDENKSLQQNKTQKKPQIWSRISNFVKETKIPNISKVFRHRNSVKIPVLDFSRLRTELRTDIDFARSLLRQSARTDNLLHLIQQLNECSRLIWRCVGSGAACLQPTGGDCKDSRRSGLESQLVLNQLAHFHAAYTQFEEWLFLVESSKETLNLPSPPDRNAEKGPSFATLGSIKMTLFVNDLDSSPKQPISHSPIPHQAPSRKSITGLTAFDLMAGEALLHASRSPPPPPPTFQTIFEQLENANLTTLMSPSQLKSPAKSPPPFPSKHGSMPDVTSKTSPPSKSSVSPNFLTVDNNNGDDSRTRRSLSSVASSIIKSPILVRKSSAHNSPQSSILTEANRQLLAKLWSHLGPPAKPSLPSANGGITVESTSPPDDYASSLGTYLDQLASTVIGRHVKVEKKRSDECHQNDEEDDIQQARPCSNIDLNSPDSLGFRLVDDSDNESIGGHSLNNSDRRRTPPPSPLVIVNGRGIEPSQARQSTPPPPKYLSIPQPTRLSISPIKDRDDDRHSTSSSKSFRSPSPRVPSRTVNLSRKVDKNSQPVWTVRSVRSAAHALNPLDDRRMQNNVAVLARRQQQLHNGDRSMGGQDGAKSDGLEQPFNPLMTDSQMIDDAGWTTVDSPTTATTSSSSIGIGGDLSKPLCESELKSDEEIDSELIEVDGRKYRRHFKRHLKVERHKVRQLVVAPSLPDGTGPDLSKAISSSSRTNQPITLLEDDTTRDPERELDEDDIGTEDSSWAPNNNDSDTFLSPYSTGTPPPKPPIPPQSISIKNSNASCANRNKLHADRSRCCESPDSMAEANPSDPHRRQQHPNNPKVSIQSPSPVDSVISSDWHKEESAEGPHKRSKSIYYFQLQTKPSPAGDIQQATSVTEKCSVQMVGGIEGLRNDLRQRQQASKLIDDNVSLSDTSNSSSLDSPVTNRSIHSTSSIEWKRPSLSSASEPSFEVYRLLESPCLEILKLLRADDYLRFSNPEETDQMTVLSGGVDALIVYMCYVGTMTHSHRLFYDAFLFTYRAFISPEDLIDRLILRYHLLKEKLSDLSDEERHAYKTACSTTICVLVNIVTYLTEDLTDSLAHILANFQQAIANDGWKALTGVLARHQRLRPHSPAILQSPPSLLQSPTLHQPTRSMSNSLLNEVANQPAPVDATTTPCRKLSTISNRSSPSKSSTPTLRNKPPRRLSFNALVVALHSVEGGIGGACNTDSQRPLTPQLPLQSQNQGYFSSLRLHRKSLTPLSVSTVTIPGLILLTYSSNQLAEQLTLIDAEKFSCIKFSELIHLDKLENGKIASLTRCAAHFSNLSNWTTSLILSVSAIDRDRVASHLLDVMERIRRHEHYMKPPRFTVYLSELEQSEPPCIPYLGVMIQLLVALGQGNPLFLPSSSYESAVGSSLDDSQSPKTPNGSQQSDFPSSTIGPIVNFWRCWKHFRIINYFVKREKLSSEKFGYPIKPNAEVLEFLKSIDQAPNSTELRNQVNRLCRETSA